MEQIPEKHAVHKLIEQRFSHCVAEQTWEHIKNQVALDELSQQPEMTVSLFPTHETKEQSCRII
jgi:hypothetical protein